MKHKFFILFIFISGFALGSTGFPTFWQYIESIGNSYLTNSTVRQTVLSEQITSGELVKANALNAKFDSLNKEISDLKTQVSGMSSVTSIKDTGFCTNADCYVEVTGIALGETVQRTFLGRMINNLVVIVNRSAYLAGQVSPETNSFSAIYYPDDVSKRVLSTDVKILTCDSIECYVEITGIALGESTPRTFLGRLINNVIVIMSRSAYLAGQVSPATNSFEALVYSNDYLKRITSNQVVIKKCSLTNCYVEISGTALGESSPRTFIGRLVNSSNNVTIMSRSAYLAGQVSPATNSFEALVYTNDYLKRITSDQITFKKCLSNDCYVSIPGVALGESSSRNFLGRFVNNSNNAVIMNLSAYLSGQVSPETNSFNAVYYPDDFSKRVLENQIIFK